MRKEYIQSAKTELERLQKQGNTAANRAASEQPAEPGNNRRDTPLSGKEKGDTGNRCRLKCYQYLLVRLLFRL